MVSRLLLKACRDGASTTSVIVITFSVLVKSTWHHFSLVLWPAGGCYGRDPAGGCYGRDPAGLGVTEGIRLAGLTEGIRLAWVKVVPVFLTRCVVAADDSGYRSEPEGRYKDLFRRHRSTSERESREPRRT